MTRLVQAWRTSRDRLISIDPGNSSKTPDVLTVAALLYLALPNLIFLAGWLRLPFAVPALALVATALWQFLHRPDLNWRLPYTTPALLLIVATALAWASLGGAGHFAFANSDWIVRDTVLADLSLTPWPPAYSQVNGVPHILRSAIGYFFPAAVLGKLWGLGSIDVALYLWTALGASLFLLLLPLPRQAGRLMGLMLVIAILFSGMDFLGIVLLTGITPIFPLRLEWWVPFSYSSLTGQLYWAPNHALPLWLATTLFYRHWGHRCIPALTILLLPLSLIWTPFVAAAMLPFIAIAVLRWFVEGRSLREWGLTFSQVLAMALLVYLGLRLLTLGIEAIPGAPTVEAAPDNGGFVLKYLLFALMEFAILALLLAREIRHSFGLFWLSFIALALLPLYQYGPSNDTMLRLSTPYLVMLLLLTLDRINHWSRLSGPRAVPVGAWAIGVVLLIGANTPFNEMWRAATFRRTPPNYGISLVEHERGEPPHYIGRLDKPDLLLLLRRSARVPTRQQRANQGLVPAGSDAR